MKNKINIFIVILMLAGVSVLSYPIVSNLLASKNHTKAIQEYSLTVTQLEAQEIQREIKKAKEYNDSLTGTQIADPFVPTSGFVLPEEYLSILNINGMIGYIEIPSIDVYLPIYHSTSEEVLLKGVGHMESTSFPVGGEGSHAVLTAHRGLPSAKLFTDLIDFEIGDIFYIHVLDQIFAYKGDQIMVVEPQETEELRLIAGEDYVTLVTCTPYAINSHRLFVRGSRIDYLPDKMDEIKEAANNKLRRRVIAAVAGVTVGSIGLVWYKKKIKKKK